MEVLVLFNYDGQAADELTIRKGDVILDVKKHEGGWWEGLLGSKRGLFPDNFVMVVTEAEMNHSLPSAVVRTEKGRKCRALFSYTPSHEDELELLVGDEIHFLGEVEEGWWRGKLAGKIGVFPSNFVVLEDAQPPSSINKPSDVAPELPPKPLKELAKVLFPYSALQPDELELKEGELVIIHSKDCEDKGWWKGEVNNKIGVFPDNFVEIIPHNTNNSVLRSEKQPATNNSNSAQVPSQSRNGDTKIEPTSPSSVFKGETNHQAFVSGNATKTAGSNLNPNISLSDEQKLQQVGEPDNFLDIPPTESLDHITASRVRPNKRRPPSALFFKEENDGSNGNLPVRSPRTTGPASLGELPVHTEEPEQFKPSSEQIMRPTTKTRTSTVKLPWMEELKRNQEMKGSTIGSQEKPSIPPAKPVVPKPPIVNPNIQRNIQSEGSTSSGESAVKKAGHKNLKVEQAVLPKTPENQYQKPSVNASGSATLGSAFPVEKKPHKESLPSGPPFVDAKKIVHESGIPTSPKESAVTGSSSNGGGENVKHKLSPALPSYVTKPLVESPQNHPVNQNDPTQLRKSDDSVQNELRDLYKRVAKLEETVTNLQSELLHLKTTHAQEHKCQCMQKSNEASLVHI